MRDRHRDCGIGDVRCAQKVVETLVPSACFLNSAFVTNAATSLGTNYPHAR
jgi:hypothetical protein